mmetsp:Transcript_9695/g.21667  ORF Transcript_9695/g.21667 Transcript_9695/m.21667 type:complete len:230 (+) Transcript_9695:2902-3591(+)
METNGTLNDFEDALPVLRNGSVSILYADAQQGLPNLVCRLLLCQKFTSHLGRFSRRHGDGNLAATLAEVHGSEHLKVTPHPCGVDWGRPWCHQCHHMTNRENTLLEGCLEHLKGHDLFAGLRFLHTMLIDAEAADPEDGILSIYVEGVAKLLNPICDVNGRVPPCVAEHVGCQTSTLTSGHAVHESCSQFAITGADDVLALRSYEDRLYLIHLVSGQEPQRTNLIQPCG